MKAFVHWSTTIGLQYLALMFQTTAADLLKTSTFTHTNLYVRNIDTGNITFVFKVRTLFPKTNIYGFNNIRASVSKNQLILKDNVVCDTEFVFP